MKKKALSLLMMLCLLLPTALFAADDITIRGLDGAALTQEATAELVDFYGENGVNLETLKTLSVQDPIAPVSVMMQAQAQDFTPLQVQQMVAGHLASTTVDVAGNTDVNLVINGKTVYSDATLGMPYINDAGRTMVPLRVIHENVSMSVVYKDGDVFIDNARIPYHAKFVIGEDEFYLNGTTIQMDTPTVVSAQSRAYVPLRALAETLGDVSWNEETRTVTVNIKVDTEDAAQNGGKSFFPVQDTTLGYQLNKADDGTPIVQRLEKEENGITDLAFPLEYADIYTPGAYDRLSISIVKSINGVNYIGIHHYVSNFDYSMAIFKDTMTAGEPLVYIGSVVETSDFTADDHRIYSTEGRHQGGFSLEKNLLYIDPIGKRGEREIVTLDFDVNENQLHIDASGILWATDVDGTPRQIENVPTNSPI